MWDSFFVIINAIVYLAITSLFSWLLDADIYINFLIIIDLGVFFVLLSFLVNFISLFQTKRLNFSNSTLLVVLPALLITSHSAAVTTPLLPLQITHYNWYSVFNFTYFTDLQLLSDVYYVFFPFEFVLMNCYLYLAILALYFMQLFFNNFKFRKSLNSETGSVTNQRGLWMRSQNAQEQTTQRASVRVWNKKIKPLT